jgi:RHS repeat-associated protein
VDPYHPGGLDTVRRPRFPRLPLGDDSTNAVLIDGDIQTFSYDPATGNLRRAANRYAIVQRTYRPSGRLRTDSLWIRTVEGGDFTRHAYGIGYRFDLAGKRQGVSHPKALVAQNDTLEWTAYDNTETGLPFNIDPPGSSPGVNLEFDPAGQLIKQTMPGNSWREFTYTLDGELATDRFIYGAVGTAISPLFATNGVARNVSLQYDVRGKLLRYANAGGFLDTLRNTYTAMGHLQRTVYANTFLLGTLLNNSVTRSDEELTQDALGNQLSGFSQSTQDLRGSFGGFSHETTRQAKNFWYRQDGSGRLDSSSVGSASPSAAVKSRSAYDSAGNVRWTVSPGRSVGELAPASERVMFYNALNQLVAVDARADGDAPNVVQTFSWLHTFDNYRYDALGRRILTRSQRSCPRDTPSKFRLCQGGFVRRTVWDGDRELWEIKMPDSLNLRENDTDPIPPSLRLATMPGQGTFSDIMGQFGRVGYVYGGAVDRPLIVLRLGYADFGGEGQSPSTPHQVFPPFALYPQWDIRGEAAFGVTDDGGGRPCISSARCTPRIAWSGLYTPVGIARADAEARQGWMGTLTEDKRELNGLLYRRNRYLDATSGRFTQPDPIGLGGGLNSYGYAAGDPVNYSDPFGLCPEGEMEVRGRCFRILTGNPLFASPGGVAAGASRAAAGAGSAARMVRLMSAARNILKSSEFGVLRAAASAGVSAEVQIAGRTILYEPGLSASGMTMFGENGFVLGRQAFSSGAETAKTILHELYRLSTSSAASAGASGASVSAETSAAARFANIAYELGRSLTIW